MYKENQHLDFIEILLKYEIKLFFFRFSGIFPVCLSSEFLGGFWSDDDIPPPLPTPPSPTPHPPLSPPLPPPSFYRVRRYWGLGLDITILSCFLACLRSLQRGCMILISIKLLSMRMT